MATVLLVGVTVAAAGTYYTTQEALTEQVEDQDTDVLETFNYQIEQCYMKNAKTKLVVRNNEEAESVNASSLSVFVQGVPEDASYSKQVVGPQETFKVTFDRNAHRKQVKLVSGEKSETKVCNIQGLHADFVYTPSNPQINDQINFDASPSIGRITSYKWDVNDDGNYENTGKDITHSYSSAGDKDVTLKVTDNDGDTDTHTQTIPVGQTTIQPTGKVHEGGDNTQNLAWGTTGDVSIKLDSSFGTPDFCIGNQCQESTGNKAPNKNTPKGPYLNREIGELNGTVKVTEKMSVNSNEDLCIGSKCGQDDGQAPPTEVYGPDGEMDGPIMIKYNGQDPRGIPTDSNGFCIGDYC